MHLQITYEFDLNLYRIDRDVYSILDLIGDLGGLAEGLFLILATLISALTYRKFDHFMIEFLYGKYENVSDDKEKSDNKLVPLSDKKTSTCR